VKIAGLLVWVLTAGIGIYLLAAGIAAQREAAGLRRPASAEIRRPVGAGPAGGGAGPAGGGGGPAGRGGGPAGRGGGPADGSGGPEAEGSPLLEFMHPLLALTGLTFWIFFVMTDDRPFAWIALGVVAATVLAGLSWAVLTGRAARRAGREPAAAFPAHLVMIHGLAAACTLTLVVISAVTAAHA
jgi:hypothetical protein